MNVRVASSSKYFGPRLRKIPYPRPGDSMHNGASEARLRDDEFPSNSATLAADMGGNGGIATAQTSILA